MLAGGKRDAGADHLAVEPACDGGLVELGGRGHGHALGVGPRIQAFVLGSTPRARGGGGCRGSGTLHACGGGQTTLILGPVVGQEEHDDLPEEATLARRVQLLSVEVKQEALEALLAPALGGDVVPRPVTRVVRGGESLAVVLLLVVDVAQAPGLPAVLAQVRPRLNLPGLGHLPRSPFLSLPVLALPVHGVPVGYDRDVLSDPGTGHGISSAP